MKIRLTYRNKNKLKLQETIKYKMLKSVERFKAKKVWFRIQFTRSHTKIVVKF